LEEILYLRLCSIGDVPKGGMRQFDLRDREFLVVELNGGFFCLDGRCTHAGAPLAEGHLVNKILTCSWHYSQFDVTTGSVVRGPAEKSLELFRMKIENGQIFIDLPPDEE
jgi:nitrite reductase/ring-hydroxylating ferredoxin subunit